MRRILAHLGLPTDPAPVTPAVVPLAPDGEWCLLKMHSPVLWVIERLHDRVSESGTGHGR